MTPHRADYQEGDRLFIWFWTGSQYGALFGRKLTEIYHVCLLSAVVKCMCQSHPAKRLKN